MSNLYPYAKKLWTLASSGLGTTLAANGNSGGWQGDTPPVIDEINFETAIQLRDITDVLLMVNIGAVTSSPTMKVGLDVFDDAGNMWPAVLQTSAITAPGAVPLLAGGLYSSSPGLVLPEWGRVSWSSLSGGTFTGCSITLYGR